jgi:hypothetical protein
MQSTTPGRNRTGAAVHPAGISRMLEAVEQLSPHVPISTAPIEAERVRNIAEAESIGSIPPPASRVKGAVKKGRSMRRGVNPDLFMDKIGERIAFERTGTRLYDALISKYLMLAEAGGEELPALDSLAFQDEESEEMLTWGRETALESLRRIRSEEQGHFLMLCKVMITLGGDPTAQTPCADVMATATMGVLQVVTDPRTTMAQCLNAMLVAELADTASWELLADLAARAGQDELAGLFTGAMAAEEQHVTAVRAWLRALTVDRSGAPAV